MAMLRLSGLYRDGRQAFEVVSYSFSVKSVCVCVFFQSQKVETK